MEERSLGEAKTITKAAFGEIEENLDVVHFIGFEAGKMGRRHLQVVAVEMIQFRKVEHLTDKTKGREVKKEVKEDWPRELS